MTWSGCSPFVDCWFKLEHFIEEAQTHASNQTQTRDQNFLTHFFRESCQKDIGMLIVPSFSNRTRNKLDLCTLGNRVPYSANQILLFSFQWIYLRNLQYLSFQKIYILNTGVCVKRLTIKRHGKKDGYLGYTDTLIEGVCSKRVLTYCATMVTY